MPPEGGVHPKLAYCVEERHGLERVAARLRALLLAHPPLVDRVLHVPHDELEPQLPREAVPELDRLGEIVARIDVKQREGNRCGAKGLLGEPRHDDRVLPSRKEEDGTLELRGDLPKDVDRLVLESLKMTPRSSLHRRVTPHLWGLVKRMSGRHEPVGSPTQQKCGFRSAPAS